MGLALQQLLQLLAHGLIIQLAEQLRSHSDAVIGNSKIQPLLILSYRDPYPGIRLVNEAVFHRILDQRLEQELDDFQIVKLPASSIRRSRPGPKRMSRMDI